MISIEAYRFFREHAGYIVGRSAECAYHLAQAEAEGKRLGFEFTWEEEQEPWDGEEPLSDDCELLWCGLTYKGEPMCGLGMIAVRSPSFIQGRPHDPYIRVVQAQLAQEALVELEDRADKDPSNLLAAGW